MCILSVVQGIQCCGPAAIPPPPLPTSVGIPVPTNGCCHLVRWLAQQGAAPSSIRHWCFLEVAVVAAPAKYELSGRNSLQLFLLFGYHLVIGVVKVLSAGSGTKQTLLGVRLLGTRRTMQSNICLVLYKVFSSLSWLSDGVAGFGFSVTVYLLAASQYVFSLTK